MFLADCVVRGFSSYFLKPLSSGRSIGIECGINRKQTSKVGNEENNEFNKN